MKLPFHSTYAEAEARQLFLLRGSSGTFEFSVKNASARDEMNKVCPVLIGDTVIIQ